MYTKLLATAALGLFTLGCLAQKDKRAEEEIIIEKKKGDKQDKTVIRIDGDKVTINGKDVRTVDGDVKINGRIIIDGDRVVVPGLRGNMAWGGERAQLGVSTTDSDKGARITEVMDETAAEKAGLKEEDIITTVGSTTIKTPDDLSKAIQNHKPGDVVDITYLRDGKQGKVKATLGKTSNAMAFRFDDWENGFREFRIDPPMARVAPRIHLDNGDMYFFQSDRPKFGMNVQDNEDGEGVAVNEVETGTNAEKAGLQKGDIITSVDGKPTPTLGELRKQLRESMSKSKVDIGITRSGSPRTLQLNIPKRIESAEL